MFTGIVQELGTVHRLDRLGSLYKLAIESSRIYKAVKTGDSISINGVCLTLVDKDKNILFFDVMSQTVQRTALCELNEKDAVNIEGALRADGALGGHFVLGHIDCVGRIVKMQKTSVHSMMGIQIPTVFDNLVVEKGSVALDGVSLTIGEASKGVFTVYLIPQTLKMTTLGMKQRGARINVEFDIIGKYLARFKEIGNTGKITESFLKDNGF